MKINKITVKCFRSIKDAEIICGDFNVFVGQNNHGKTNLFEAIDFFFSGLKKGQNIEDLRFCRQGKDEVMVQLEFIGAQDGADKMKNEANQTKIKNTLDGSDTIVIKRSSQDAKNRMISVNDQWLEKLPTGFDRALNDFLPKFEYVDTKKYLEDVAKFGKTTPVGVMLSGVLTTILEKSAQYQAFHDKFEELFGSDKSDVKIELDKLSDKVKIYLEKQFPDCTKVRFEVSPPIFEDLLKSFDTTIDDGVETNAADKGDGMQRALMLAILQAYADFRKENEDIGKSFLFFIDEAELHLHPTAQRNLKNVLLDLSNEEDQVFLNTHSSVLVADEHEHQNIFKVEKLEIETLVKLVDEAEKPYIVYDLLGGNPADLLLPRNFFIVEGISELWFLREIIRRHYNDQHVIQIIQANGDLAQVQRSINSIEKLFIPLEKSLYNDKVIILCDKPTNQGALDQFLANFSSLKSNNQIFVLDVGNIEEYYPDTQDWRRTKEQVDSMTGFQKKQLGKRVGENITKEEFENEMPIVFEALNRCWELSY